MNNISPGLLQLYCALPENIHTPPTSQKGLEFPGLNWNFQIGGEVLEKIPSTGEVWMFVAIHIFLYNLITRMQIQGKKKIYFYIMYVK